MRGEIRCPTDPELPVNYEKALSISVTGSLTNFLWLPSGLSNQESS